MDLSNSAVLEKIDYKRISSAQKARLEPHLQSPEVQERLGLELLNVGKTIDVMSGRVRRCLDVLWVQIFDTIAAEREQKKLTRRKTTP